MGLSIIAGQESSNDFVFLFLFLVNSADPDEVAYYVAFHLGLHFLLYYVWERSGSVVE